MIFFVHTFFFKYTKSTKLENLKNINLNFTNEFYDIQTWDLRTEELYL